MAGSKLVAEGNVKLYWKEGGFVNPAEPTVTELQSAVHLTPHVPVSGVQITWNTNNASISMLEEGFIAERPGTRGVSIQITGVRYDADDDFFDLFDYQAEGDLLVSRKGVPTDGSDVEVYRVSCHDVQADQLGDNTYQTCTVPMPCEAAYPKASLVNGS